ncbi:DUF6285 domain-containing protein [Nocardia sp. CDC159]|uniref:DUF6285 domain-containing protein n=1 Tax=Nocardia pulmonis TaxID=2951408 RepID=A0A9X2ECF7_9NOCA|nr:MULTISPECIES: DUF6285 domain-containing protein [Nocardia]MCM6776673.1 DUF6285 domain-containing protein [Nocardia pulmonis]MCM6789178.1 DUF6285 domain-containing protein [Nocardia sp. CDC159]
MQYRPTATEILDSVAELLDNTLLPALPEELRHRARVAANLTRIVRRELELGPAAQRREDELLSAVGPEVADGVVPAGTEAALWRALVEVVRDDLAIAKPGYDQWEGR